MLRSFKPDAVITFLPLANVMGQGAAWLSGVPARVASQRNPYATYHPVMRVLDKLAGTLGIYTDIVPNSRSVYESFASHPSAYRRRMTVVHNGMAWQPSTMTREEARAAFGLPRSGPVIVNVARLFVEKNHAFLLDVLRRLPGMHLAIAGDGRLREQLREQAKALGVAERTHFLLTLERAQIPNLLKAADLFVLPSLFEGHSNALLEAMNAGLPVVVGNIPPNVEALETDDDDPAGVVLPLGDGPGWADAIDRVMSDEDLRRRLGERARHRAAPFSIERMADGFEALLRPPLAGTSRSGPLPSSSGKKGTSGSAS
jgi:glycosyltransferase involved in cell wall biosynthesis